VGKPPKYDVVDAERFREMNARADARRAADLMAAKERQHAQGKEPFDMATFQKLYDTTDDSRSPARFEELYYVVHSSRVRTIEEFAKLMAEHDLWRD
jgi:hypothetical protein